MAVHGATLAALAPGETAAVAALHMGSRIGTMDSMQVYHPVVPLSGGGQLLAAPESCSWIGRHALRMLYELWTCERCLRDSVDGLERT